MLFSGLVMLNRNLWKTIMPTEGNLSIAKVKDSFRIINYFLLTWCKSSPTSQVSQKGTQKQGTDDKWNINWATNFERRLLTLITIFIQIYLDTWRSKQRRVRSNIGNKQSSLIRPRLVQPFAATSSTSTQSKTTLNLEASWLC